jgi:integrase
MFVGAYLSFLGLDDVAETFHRWSMESQHAEILAAVGDRVRATPGWPDAVRPFGEDQLVRKRMHGALDLQYLAATCAVRRPAVDQALSQFIIRLRALCLLRAVEALDWAGIAHESSLNVACTVIRKACDDEGDRRLPWLEEIATSSSSLVDFLDTLMARCRLAPSKVGGRSDERDFYAALSVVIAGGPWVPEARPGSSLGTPVFPPLAKVQRPVDLRWIVQDDLIDSPVNLPTGDGGTVTVQTVSSDPLQTIARNKRDGAGVVIESVEAVQYLRHSWHHLSDQEQAALLNRTGKLLDGTEPIGKLGAALVLVAYLASLPLSAVGALTISTEPCGDWRLDPEAWDLHRLPPRFGRGWRADGESASWVAPRADRLRIELHHSAVAALRDAWHLTQCFDLDGLWGAASPKVSLEAWFSAAIASEPGLDRLTGPALSNALAVQIYERAEDQVFARLLGSNARSGLPAACAYGSYSTAQVIEAYGAPADRRLWAPKAIGSTADFNAAGSELMPIVSHVRSEIQEMFRRTRECWCEGRDWVERHNLLTSLTVTSLLASTGARPISSPFETLSWIDRALRRIYVEDKVAGPTGGGRLCVLGSAAHRLIFEVYLPHLHEVHARVKQAAPEFAAKIEQVLASNPEADLPLFFFLRCKPRWSWCEVTETQLQLLSGVKWPLPWNLFRHLHAVLLVRDGVHAEIVDALLAHADRGAESHGDYSMRILAADLEAARPAVNRLLGDLGFSEEPWGANPAPLQPEVTEEIQGPPGQAYGREARAEAREQRREAGRKQALADIDDLVAGRPLDSLSAEDWDEIALAMLFREKGGMPHPAASLRYSVLEDYLNQIWRKQRVVAKLKRRYVLLQAGESLVTERVIEAIKKLPTLAAGFEDLLSTYQPGRISARHSALLAALDLIVNSRVANARFLIDLLHLRASVQCVQFQGVDWIEWLDAKEWRDGRPVFRVAASARAAAFVARAVGGKHELRTLPEVPDEILRLSDSGAGSRDASSWIRDLCRLQDQLNVLELPGVHAAYLAGRSVLCALPHADWFRLTRAVTPVTPEKRADPDDDEADMADSDVAYIIKRRPSADRQPAKTSTPDACRKLIESIKDCLKADDPRTACSAIADAVIDSDYGPGDAPFVFGSFICHLLTRKPKKANPAGRDRLRVSTVQRALYALSAPLTDLCHDINLEDLDEDELTGVYSSLVEWWDEHFDEDAAAKLTKHEEQHWSRLSREERVADASRRTLARLQEFHAYARTAFGLEDPDWAEITAAKAGISGRPGYVRVAEYLDGIQRLLAGRSVDELPADELATALVWLLCGRFGLRLGEAVGIYRHDIVELHGALVVLVRSNHARPLKTTKSKRKVPLVEQLQPTERQILDEALRRWQNQHKQGVTAPLLNGVDRNSFRRLRSQIGEVLRHLVRDVTGNPDSTLHMLRHSFATRVFALLNGRTLGVGEPFTSEQTTHARRLLLGGEQCGRRVLWAVARLLGHASPAATSRSYLHGIETWLPRPPAVAPILQRKADWQVTVNLDAWQIQAKTEVVDRISERKVHTEPALLRLMNCGRLVADGFALSSATNLSRVSATTLDAFIQTIIAAQRRHYPGTTPEPAAALTVLPLTQWEALIAKFGSKRSRLSLPEYEVDLTLGRRRQVILFDEEHFTSFADFIQDIELDAADVALVQSPELDQDVIDWISHAGLAELVQPRESMPPTFQLDTTVARRPRQPVTHRVVAVRAKTSETLLNNTWLWVLWAAWNVAVD